MGENEISENIFATPELTSEQKEAAAAEVFRRSRPIFCPSQRWPLLSLIKYRIRNILILEV
jgi:hypothetical protein